MRGSVTFRAWLKAQAKRGDAVGDFARDVAADRCARWLRTPGQLGMHIQTVHHPIPAVEEALARSVREWKAQRAGARP